MKKITAIEYQKKSNDRVNIYVDDKFECGIDVNIMLKYGLCKNKEIDDNFMRDVVIADERKKAFNYAVAVLSRSSKTEKEIILKMKDKCYDDELIDMVVDKLKSYQYIDDENYAERFIQTRANSAKDGKRKIQQALYEKGIDKCMITEKLSVVSRDDEFGRAMEIAKKKFASLTKDDPKKQRSKLSGLLIRKGYDYEIANKVIQKLLKRDFDEYENEYEDGYEDEAEYE